MKEEGGFGAGSVMFSFLLGGLVGAGLTLLLSPLSGPEARRRLHEYADEFEDRAERYAHDATEKASAAVEKGKDYLEDKKSVVSSAVDAGKEAYDRERKRQKKEA
ncbi:MAG: YtxH domain-containing protein [Nitrospirota bacterium]|jgi:gas vesicle protein